MRAGRPDCLVGDARNLGRSVILVPDSAVSDTIHTAQPVPGVRSELALHGLFCPGINKARPPVSHIPNGMNAYGQVPAFLTWPVV